MQCERCNEESVFPLLYCWPPKSLRPFWICWDCWEAILEEENR